MIEGTQIPTNTPSSLLPRNHKDTEKMKEAKAAIRKAHSERRIPLPLVIDDLLDAELRLPLMS